MKYWQYRAFNARQQLVSGVASGDDPMVITVALRQLCLQVYDMSTINAMEYRRRAKHDPLIKKIGKELPKAKTVTSKWLVDKSRARARKRRLLGLAVLGSTVAAVLGYIIWGYL